MYNISCNLKAAYESESKEVVKAFEKSILLPVIDEAWKENLRELDELKHSVQNACLLYTSRWCRSAQRQDCGNGNR